MHFLIALLCARGQQRTRRYRTTRSDGRADGNAKFLDRSVRALLLCVLSPSRPDRDSVLVTRNVGTIALS